MPFRRRRMKRKTGKFVTKRGLPFQLMKYADTKRKDFTGAKTLPLIPTLAANAQSIHELVAGTNFNERIGTTIQVSGFVLSYDMQALGVANNRGRIIIYTPRDDSNLVLPVTSITEFPNPDNYIIWMDRKVYPGGQEGNGTGLGMMKFKWKPYRKFIYEGSGSLSIQTGSTYILFLTAVDEGILVNYDVRLWFKDL